MIFSELLAGVDIMKKACDADLDITGIAYDSRRVKAGNVFVAITGYKTDGHKYIESAAKAGAAVVVCQEKPDLDIPYVLVENSRAALAQISANFYNHPQRRMKVIGITGTNGKTTTTYLIKSMLEDRGEKVGLIGTNQNMIGAEILPTERTTPESCELMELMNEMADKGCSYVIMEVSSHSLVLSRVKPITFDVAVFTNLTQDHLDFHGTMEEYAKAKALLFKQCKVGIINKDDPACTSMIEDASCDIITYGIKSDADICAKNVRLKPSSVEFEALCFESIGRIELNIPGEFSVYNALAAISVSLMCGATLEQSGRALAGVGGVKGRAEVVPTPCDYTVMIDYAHSPDGLENILATVRGFAENRVIVVFGCGGDRDRTKRPKMGAVASAFADYLVITSDNPRTEDPASIIDDILPGISKKKSEYHVEADRKKAIHHALEIAKEGDVIVLAGKGHETYQEINNVKNHMDEREIVAEYFEER